MLSQFDEFTSAIEPIKHIWRWIDVRVLAVDERDLGWLCDYLRVVFVATKPTRWKDLPEVEGLLVRHEILPMDGLGDLFAMVGSGDVRLGDEVIHIRQGGSSQFQVATGYSTRWFERPISAGEFGVDCKTFALQTWISMSVTNERYRRFELLDGRLKDHNPPWDGLSHLRTAFLSMNANAAARQDAAHVDILAPLFLRLGPRCSVRGTRCTIEPEVEETLKTEFVAAALFGFEGATISHSQRVRFSPAEGTSLKKVGLPKRFNPVRCVLTYRGMSAEVRDLYQDLAKVPGARWAAFRAIVGPPEELEEALSEKSSDPLEHAIATLLHLMGFSVVHYGRNTFARGGDMADIVAFSEDGSVILLVECTARAVDPSSEIAKLATRARELQNRVSNAVVQPVFWTQQQRAELIDPAIDLATKERVAIITLDELKDLMNVATHAPSASRATQVISGLIPVKSTF